MLLFFVFFLSFQDEVQSLILQRNEVQKQFYSTVEEFIIEVEELPLSERLETLQVGNRAMCIVFVFLIQELYVKTQCYMY